MLRYLMVVPVLAIGLATPVAAQPISQPEAAQAARSVTEAFFKALSGKDAAAVAALFTEDAIRLTPGGPQNGRAEIQKFWTEAVKSWEPAFFRVDQVVPLGSDAVLAVNSWAGTYHGPNGPVGLRGYDQLTEVRDGAGWKIRMETYNETVVPPATQPKQ